MFQLLPNKYILLLLVTMVLLAMPVYSQENQTVTKPNVGSRPRKSGASASTASLTKRNQKKQLASVKNKLIAEKEKLWAEERKPASTVNSNDAEQDKPAAPAAGGDDTAELAKKLANPVASLISVPLQSNFDVRMGAGNGWRYTLNVQPVIPVKLSPNWNLISRTIIPIIHQSNVTGPGQSQSGLGDITQSLFFSPNKSEPFIWAVGPVFLVPTATNAALGTQKFGLGPTVLVLKQQHGWTVGFLGNHIWSVAGKSSRAAVNSTFVQPFLSYSTRDGWTYGVNTERQEICSPWREPWDQRRRKRPSPGGAKQRSRWMVGVPPLTGLQIFGVLYPTALRRGLQIFRRSAAQAFPSRSLLLD